MNDMDRIFSDFDNADPSAIGGRSENISTPGNFKCEIAAIKLKKSEMKSKIYYIVEFKILESSTETVVEGRTYAWVHDMTSQYYGAANCKQFICAALGIDPSTPEALKVKREAIEESWSDDQPLTGEIVTLETSMKDTRSGGVFTVHSWGPAV